ncbi:PREDICTED: uncharacterized protein LOC109225053 [Nicotiana attenuata]|uniref:uncharacterized protein LOC109225053 n=1 Tax=Nicotiana attenuata TaxID=49451 RepID=UPI000905A7A1|nr:PREDICTED: uncharacterized protein LOC109225053 [Nicotiana attenuata]
MDNRELLFYIFLLISSAQLIPYVHGDFLWGQDVDVILKNELHVPATVRCKSSDDDLGEHQVWPSNTYKFSFKTNFWGTTLFWCKVWYKKYPESNSYTEASFEVYSAEKHPEHCDRICTWELLDSGIYSYDPYNNRSIKEYDWNN